MSEESEQQTNQIDLLNMKEYVPNQRIGIKKIKI
jgi:hypothetical protein